MIVNEDPLQPYECEHCGEVFMFQDDCFNHEATCFEQDAPAGFEIIELGEDSLETLE